METFSEGFSFQGLIKEIHFTERWRWEEKRCMRAEGQCYTVMVAQVFQVGGSGDAKGFFLQEIFVLRAGVFTRHCARNLFWVTDPSRCTLNPPPSSLLPAQRVLALGGTPHQWLLYSLASSWVSQWRVLTRHVGSRSGRRVRSGYLFPWFLDCTVFMRWIQSLIFPLISSNLEVITESLLVALGYCTVFCGSHTLSNFLFKKKNPPEINIIC